MPNTYTQLHIQIVFAVRFRKTHIKKEWKDELYKYITGIIQNCGHKVLQINGMSDHIHILIGMRPNYALSDLVQKIKVESTKWINERNFTPHNFRWQGGFGAFSYSKSEVSRVIAYIENQEIHHRKKSFQEEYIELLEAFDIDYDRKYIFKPME